MPSACCRMGVSAETARLAEVWGTPALADPAAEHVLWTQRAWRAQPDALEGARLDAWYMDSSSADQRLPHRCWKSCVAFPLHFLSNTAASLTGRLCCLWPARRRTPNAPVSAAALRELGVLYWRLDADAHATDPRLRAIREVRGYSYEVRSLRCVRAKLCQALALVKSLLKSCGNGLYACQR